MGTPEITLNGIDWSNLYVVDYPGGAGGELFSEMLNYNLNAYRFINKSENNITVIDSIGNGLSSGNLLDVVRNIYPNLNKVEDIANTKELEISIKASALLWDFSNSVVDKSGDTWDLKTTDTFLSAAIRYFKNIDFLNYIVNSNINENIVARSHGIGLPLEELKNSHVIRLYPSSENSALLLNFRMSVSKWLTVKEIKDTDMFYRKNNSEWIKEIASVQNNKLFEWQIECEYANTIMTFNDFLENVFDNNVIIDDDKDNTIDAFNWTFLGLNEKEKMKFKDVIGVDYKEPNTIKNWRLKNNELYDIFNIDIHKPISKNELIYKSQKTYNRICKQITSL